MVKRKDAVAAACSWCVVAILASVLFGVFVSLSRSRVGTLDLWYDDAWVALSQRTSLSQAIHMGVGAPGFTIVMRWWMGLAEGSIPWAQSFALVPLLFAPFVIFIAARTAGAARAAAAFTACLCALSPILLVESARVKQYTWEYAFSAVLVAIAAAIRRDGPTMRWTISAACFVVVAVLFSFVMLFPTVLVYLVLAVALLHEARAGEQPFDLRRIGARLAVLGSAGLVVLLWTRALLPNPPDRLQDHWTIGFLGSGDSLSHTARQTEVLTRGFWGAFFYRGSTVLVVIPVVLLGWYALRRWRTVWWLLLAPLLAIALSVLRLYPLGSIVQARVDAWLIPWIAVPVALALTELARLPVAQHILRRVPPTVRIVAVGVVVLLVGAGVARDADGYPPTRARAAVTAIVRAARSGEPTYVAKNDWPVDLLLPGPIRIVDDRNSESQFSVVLEGRPRTLHVEDVPRAARELRGACGHTATIAGVTTESLRPILPRVGCPFRDVQSTTNGTGLPHDD
ncbi:MAG: hypothetical protein ACXW2Y_10780, partial [Acidimicrobiia bacterium]